MSSTTIENIDKIEKYFSKKWNFSETQILMIREKSPSFLREKVRQVEWLIQNKPNSIINAESYLYKSITNDWKNSDYLKRDEEKKRETRADRELEARNRRIEKARREHEEAKADYEANRELYDTYRFVLFTLYLKIWNDKSFDNLTEEEWNTYNRLPLENMESVKKFLEKKETDNTKKEVEEKKECILFIKQLILTDDLGVKYSFDTNRLINIDTGEETINNTPYGEVYKNCALMGIKRLLDKGYNLKNEDDCSVTLGNYNQLI